MHDNIVTLINYGIDSVILIFIVLIWEELKKINNNLKN